MKRKIFLAILLIPIIGFSMPEKILPKPIMHNFSLDKAIALRRSVRSFSAKPIADQQLANLLWAAQGITDKKRNFRSAPSAGALYPLEIYVVNAESIYHYSNQKNTLKIIEKGDFRKNLANAALDQTPPKEAPASIIITAIYNRTTKKYGQRGIRYTDMEAGHAAQNLALEAVSQGLGTVTIGAFNDKAIQKLLKLSNYEIPLYIIPVGLVTP